MPFIQNLTMAIIHNVTTIHTMDNSLDGVVKGWMIVVSLFCTVLSIGFTFSVMYGHLQNFTKPEEQKQTQI